MSTAKNKIVVIDDDNTVQSFVRAVLDSHYEVVSLNTCSDISEVIKFYNPDLLLIDLKIPGADGYELCRMAKEISSVFVILMTGVDLKAIKNNYQIISADDYILKPFLPETLTEKISCLFSSLPAQA